MARSRLVMTLYASTLFVASYLLFLVQPMQGKALLPILGGTPAVWNTCMVFFQTALLTGYLYAHCLATRLRLRSQIATHLIVIALPLIALPIMLPQSMLNHELLKTSPALWLVLALTLSTGPAFLALSTTSPLLQSWFNCTETAGSKNPFMLYAAGNAGSLLALLTYPFLIEPYLRLEEQMQLWVIGYGVVYVLIAIAGLFLLKRSLHANPIASPIKEEPSNSEKAPGCDQEDQIANDSLDTWLDVPRRYHLNGPWGQRLYWTLLAFVPSSLMLGVTSFMTTDVAAIPMLWLLPLTLYILSFVIVFARWSIRADTGLRMLLPALLMLTFVFFFAEYRQNLWAIMSLHLTAFFATALTCHGRLALLTPEPKRLTEYYLCLSLGGVLGGGFNTFIAPTLFNSVAEYPLLMILAIGLCYRSGSDATRSSRDAGWALSALACMALIMRGMTALYSDGRLEPIVQAIEPLTYWLAPDVVRTTLLFVIPVMLVAMTFYNRPLRLSFGLLGICIVALVVDPDATIIHRERSFFGVLTVKRYQVPTIHALVHGGILHGEQRFDTPDDRAVPRSYYHPDGPLGQIISSLHARLENPHIAAIGLGSGALAAYGTSENDITFFELDPNVERLARDTRYFTYLDDCQRRWCNLRVEIGDGRLGLMGSTKQYDLIVVDAFSSDAIPIHLLTTEALHGYLSKLNPGGVLAFHISNRYVNLEPVLLELAQAHNLGYAVREEEGHDLIGKGASTWAILAREDGDFNHITLDQRWRGLEPKDGVGLWADDYANVTRVFTWF